MPVCTRNCNSRDNIVKFLHFDSSLVTFVTLTAVTSTNIGSKNKHVLIGKKINHDD